MDQQPQCQECPLGVATDPQPCPFAERHVPAGRQLLEQGLVANAVLYIRSGFLLLDSVTGDGETRSARLRGPGSLVGVEALRRAPSPHHAWSLTDVTLCRIDGADFAQWLGPQRTPAGAVLRMAIDEVAQREDERMDASDDTVRRVARLLLSWRDLGGELDAVPRQVLARVLNIRPETLSRALRRLRDDGALPPGRRLTVASDGALRLAAGRRRQRAASVSDSN